ncbi:TAXI family TRAP transporter solute-binding subunit [Hydrogenophaga sp.]|uniref:TAXI family TRAP transporter solute-binding subunit n=1 Tax=Hydrogenophaga sp. TaxID=1904254 RepID=UPI00260D18B9|nr:TAXI family TRAP transporter solute-binding subunit [Hydrogenophaga sp.]
MPCDSSLLDSALVAKVGLRRRCLLAAPFCACLLALPRKAATQPSAGNAPSAVPAAWRPLRLGTSTPGGGFSQYDELLQTVLNRRQGRDWLHARPTRGTVDNLDLLQRGELDMALIQGTSADEVLQKGPAGGLCILYAMYPSPGMLAVPRASAARRLEDLAGKPVVFGVRTSGLVALARQVFTGIGLDIDRDFKAIYVERAADSPRIVLTGEADALWGAGEGWPGFVQVAQSPGGARFIGPSPAQIPGILARYPLLKGMEVPAQSYPGIESPLPTVGSVNLILARADLDDARAAAFVEAMQQAGPELTAALPQAHFSTLANTLASAPARELLHRVLRD